MRYDRALKLYICTNCGIMLTRDELEMRKERRLRRDEEKSEIREYYEWWISRKE